MSTIDRPQARVLSPLLDGQRLDQPTFHERYAAMPAGTWAELVGGVVFLPSPNFQDEQEIGLILTGWSGCYQRSTPGLRGARKATTKLNAQTEVHPDILLRISEESGGRVRIIDGYVAGPPEMIIEVGKSSRSHDLGPKKAEYEKSGVPEYLFVGIEPNEVRWFVRRDGRFQEMTAEEDGLFRSEVFPGLWLDPRALFAEDLEGLIAALERGLATPEHADFVARLTAPRTGG